MKRKRSEAFAPCVVRRASMAAPNPEKTLQDEATCSICLDYFQTPMMIIDCGHNFCHACIAQCCAGAGVVNLLSCPQCRKAFPRQNLLPNRHLWNIVELAKQFSARRAGEAGEPQALCEKHREPLKLFCERDRVAICVVCDRSKAHKNHSVVPIEEAAQVYQDKIHSCLQILKEDREKVSSLQFKVEKPIQDLLKETEAERQKLVSEFQQLRQLLEIEEQRLLTRLKELETQAEQAKKENATRFSAEFSQLDALIRELEQKGQEPPSGVLKDIDSILKRCKKDKFQPPVLPDSSKLKRELQEFSKKRAALQDELKKSFREILSKSQWIEEYVTLDPETAHARFVMLEGRRGVTLGADPILLPYSAKRFHPVRCVLGSQGFSSGKHHWLVDVSIGTFWAVGVARESVKRKGTFRLESEEGIWAVSLHNGQYKALTLPPTILNFHKHLKKIQICLDYEGGAVDFVDAETKKSFFFFGSVKFEGERIFPFFRIGHEDTSIWLC